LLYFPDLEESCLTAYFAIRRSSGGEDVEVVPAKHDPGAIRPATVDLAVRLASVTIKSHANFDVYPKSMVGDCEPLIQLHTTTSETIALQEVRGPLSAEQRNLDRSYMFLQERKTDKRGFRQLSIRPAIYEKVSVWNTFS
jgi:hypothetical protein